MNRTDALINQLVMAYAPASHKKELIRLSIMKCDFSIIHPEAFHKTAAIFDNAFAVLKRYSFSKNIVTS